MKTPKHLDTTHGVTEEDTLSLIKQSEKMLADRREKAKKELEERMKDYWVEYE